MLSSDDRTPDDRARDKVADAAPASLLVEIARQRQALLAVMRDPKVLYVGILEYRELRRVCQGRVVFHQRSVDPRAQVEEYFDGMRIMRRIDPGVHVCEAPPP